MEKLHEGETLNLIDIRQQDDDVALTPNEEGVPLTPVLDLPSQFKGYPKGTKINYTPITLGELEALNVTGTKLTKQMIIVPINNTLLYVEPVYQTMLNESDVPILKKVIVASGNKVAIGDTLTEALQNLLSRYATNIEVEDTEDIEGLINAIIRANQNLTESNENNDWEMMGSDLARLQELINRLEQAKEEEERNNADKEDLTTNTESGNEINSTNTSSDGENIMVMDRNTLD